MIKNILIKRIQNILDSQIQENKSNQLCKSRVSKIPETFKNTEKKNTKLRKIIRKQTRVIKMYRNAEKQKKMLINMVKNYRNNYIGTQRTDLEKPENNKIKEIIDQFKI